MSFKFKWLKCSREILIWFEFSDERLIELRLFDDLVRDLWREGIGEFFIIGHQMFSTATTSSTENVFFVCGVWVSHRPEQLSVNLYENGWCAHWRPTATEIKNPNAQIDNFLRLRSTFERPFEVPSDDLVYFRFFFLYVYCVDGWQQQRASVRIASIRSSKIQSFVSFVRWAIKFEIRNTWRKYNGMNTPTDDWKAASKRRNNNQKTFDELGWQVCEKSRTMKCR